MNNINSSNSFEKVQDYTEKKDCTAIPIQLSGRGMVLLRTFTQMKSFILVSLKT